MVRRQLLQQHSVVSKGSGQNTQFGYHNWAETAEGLITASERVRTGATSLAQNTGICVSTQHCCGCHHDPAQTGMATTWHSALDAPAMPGCLSCPRRPERRLTVMIMLRTLAVLPACRRTPLASYMTTMLNMSAIANSALLVPRMTPSAVVSPSTCTMRRSTSYRDFTQSCERGGFLSFICHTEHKLLSSRIKHPCALCAVLKLVYLYATSIEARHRQDSSVLDLAVPTIEVCEDGMPPDPTTRVKSHRFSV